VKAVAGGVVGFILLLACGLVAVMVGVGGGTPSATAIGTCATDANLAPILTTIRSIETGGNYATTITTSTASGAYAFLDGTWNEYGGYARAADAPPDLQDQKAAELVRAILTANDDEVSAIPVAWYIGHVPAPESSEWDTIPAPDGGNRLTPRDYQTKWMAEYDRQQAAAGGPTAATSCSAPAPSVAAGSAPDHLDCGTFSWGGYANGQIPLEAMRYRPISGYLFPAASAAFDEMYAAAQRVGLDLRGSGYRPASAGGNTAGKSCHGLGMAVDIAVLTGDTTTAFASPAFTWLCANAEQYGWITPRWAIPAGRTCGTVVGTGAGGNVGYDCCFLEPWHIEAAGIVATDPTFGGAVPRTG
jgi:hypothetical protein